MGAHDRNVVSYSRIVDIDLAPVDLLARPSARLLVKLAARHWGVRAELLPGPSRDGLVVAARHHAMWLIRTHTRMSLPQIGQMLGGRDHATVLSGIASHQKRMAGAMPVPFIWTPQRASKVLQLARTGATLGEIGRSFSLQYSELARHPHYAALKRHALQALTDRRIQYAIAKKAEARP